MTKEGKWHFIGIGGVGMSGIAKACLELGKPVSGSDMASSDLTKSLAALGAEIYIGAHDPARITEDLEVVVVSSAIRQDNPEWQAAAEKGISVIHRGSCLARLMDHKKGIAVAGAHGKTTTSAMIALLLEKGGLDPAFFIGAYVDDLKTNAKWGQGAYLVAEADESDGSFLELNPVIALVTNVENDHLDHYGSQEKINDAFVQFINHIPEEGRAILCLDDPGLRNLLPRINHQRVMTYGFAAEAELRGENLQSRQGIMTAEVYRHDIWLGTLRLQVYGKHNLLNALGALAAGLACGLEFAELAELLQTFRGAHRRLERLGQGAGIQVYDDYAHHPTEIKATLAAAKMIDAKRIMVVFQPHRYTRTQLLAEEFGDAFVDGDGLILLPIYGAGEKPIPGVTAELIVESIQRRQGSKTVLAEDFAAGVTLLLGQLQAGDLVLTLGAGNVRQFGEMLLEALGQ